MPDAPLCICSASWQYLLARHFEVSVSFLFVNHICCGVCNPKVCTYRVLSCLVLFCNLNLLCFQPSKPSPGTSHAIHC